MRAVELYRQLPKRIVIPLNAHPIHYFNTWPYLDDFDRIEASERPLTALADLIIESGSQREDLSANQANTELDSMPSIAAPSPYAGLVQREAQGVLPPAVSRFDRFTQEIRDAITLAGAEKQRRHLAWVGTEHLLLGVLGAKNGGALEVLYNLGVSLDDVGRRAQSTPSRDHWQADKSVFSANATRALELATYEVQRAGHGFVGTVHLLLGLVAEDRGTAVEVLSNTSVTLSGVREEMHRLLR